LLRKNGNVRKRRGERKEGWKEEGIEGGRGKEREEGGGRERGRSTPRAWSVSLILDITVRPIASFMRFTQLPIGIQSRRSCSCKLSERRRRRERGSRRGRYLGKKEKPMRCKTCEGRAKRSHRSSPLHRG